ERLSVVDDDRPLFGAVGAHNEKLAFPAPSRGEDNKAAVRRPTGVFVVAGSPGEAPLDSGEDLDGINVEAVPAFAFDVYQGLTVPRPGRGIAVAGGGEPAQARAVQAHHINMRGAVAVGSEGDLASVRRKSRGGVG